MNGPGNSDPDGDGTPPSERKVEPSDAATSVAFGGARPKVGRHRPRGANSKSSVTTGSQCQAASPPTWRLDGFRGDDRLSSLDSNLCLADDSSSYPAYSRLSPEELSFDVNPPLLRARRPRELLRTNSSDSFLPSAASSSFTESMGVSAAGGGGAGGPLRSSPCLIDVKRSSFDESRLLDLCAGGGSGGCAGSMRSAALPDGGGAAACSVPSITSSSVSMSDLRPDAALSELDLYEAPEDDCYIYTYKGGTAYLSADLPHSFFRLDSGSDGESLPGVSGAGQSNLSTGIAALIQDQLISGPPRPDSPEEQDFLELDFDPGSEGSDSSSDSGQGREELDEAAPPPPPVARHHHRTPSPLHHHHPHGLPTRHSPAHPPPAAESRRLSRTGRYYSGDQLPLVAGSKPEPVSRTDLDLPLLSVNTVAAAFETPTGRNVGVKEVARLQNNNNNDSQSFAEERKPMHALLTESASVGCVSCHNNSGHADRLGLPSASPAPPAFAGRLEESPRSPQADGVLSAVSDVHSAPLTSPADGQLVLLSLPRSKSLNSSFSSGCFASGIVEEDVAAVGRFNHRLLSREAQLLRCREDLTQCIADPLARLALSASDDVAGGPAIYNNLLLAPRAMIWTEKEACRKHVIQIGRSACGATALINVAIALNLELSLGDVVKAVKTRQRRELSDLPDYLHSRAEAGCTHEDLLVAMRSFSGQNRVVGRFFPMHGRKLTSLATWLATWINRGCVPVATLNPQRGGVLRDSRPSPQHHSSSTTTSASAAAGPPAAGGLNHLLLPDAWHHQMIFGVTGSDIYLTNPLEAVPQEVLRLQLDSPSELLVRREDVIARFSKATDLTQLLVRPPTDGPAETTTLCSGDRRWHDYNVLGQVANVLREERSRNLSECENVCLTPYVCIPCSYRSGITLFCEAADAELVSLLNAAPDFPLLQD